MRDSEWRRGQDSVGVVTELCLLIDLGLVMGWAFLLLNGKWAQWELQNFAMERKIRGSISSAALVKTLHAVMFQADNKVLGAASAAVLDRSTVFIDAHIRGTMLELVNGNIGTKFTGQLGALFADLAIDTTTTIGFDIGQNLREAGHAKVCAFFRNPKHFQETYAAATINHHQYPGYVEFYMHSALNLLTDWVFKYGGLVPCIWSTLEHSKYQGFIFQLANDGWKSNSKNWFGLCCDSENSDFTKTETIQLKPCTIHVFVIAYPLQMQFLLNLKWEDSMEILHRKMIKRGHVAANKFILKWRELPPKHGTCELAIGIIVLVAAYVNALVQQLLRHQLIPEMLIVALFMKLEFYSLKRQELNFKKILKYHEDGSISVIISEFIKCSAVDNPALKMINISTHENVLQLTPEGIVDELPDQALLSTVGLKLLIPQLYKQYPNDDLNLIISVSSPSVIEVSDQDIGATICMDIIFGVLESSRSDLLVVKSCASLALAVAGIMLYDLIASVLMSYVSKKLVIGPMLGKGSYHDGSLMLTCMPSLYEITQLTFTWRWFPPKGKKALKLKLDLDACADIATLMQSCLNEAASDLQRLAHECFIMLILEDKDHYNILDLRQRLKNCSLRV